MVLIRLKQSGKLLVEIETIGKDKREIGDIENGRENTKSRETQRRDLRPIKEVYIEG